MNNGLVIDPAETFHFHSSGFPFAPGVTAQALSRGLSAGRQAKKSTDLPTVKHLS
jgi:hypothetical protein